jgi:hypothetical protein
MDGNERYDMQSPMTRDELIEKLNQLDACYESLAWVNSTPGTPRELWERCKNGEWLLWLIEAVGRSFSFGSSRLILEWDECEANLDVIRDEFSKKASLILVEYEPKLARIGAKYESSMRPLRAELESNLAQIRIKYEAQTAPNWEEYELDVAPIRAAHDLMVEPIRAENQRKLAHIQVERDAKFAPVRAEYDRKSAEIVRSTVSWDEVEAVMQGVVEAA